MKAEVINSFEISYLQITTTTVLFARKVDGTWRVHLNYNRINVRYSQNASEADRTIDLLKGVGISVQSDENIGFASFVCLLLGSVGVIADLIALIRQVIEVLADVRSLVPKVLSWLQKKLTEILTGQEPALQNRLEQAIFVLNLFKSGAYVERRLPRWRENFKDK